MKKNVPNCCLTLIKYLNLHLSSLKELKNAKKVKWDYGYQITGMANRTVLTDNNTWNNTHIATVGKAFALDEKGGYDVARFMGADYVLVIFGGMTNFSGDDISKFMWMIRIAAAEFPEVKEDRFYNK